MEGKDFNFREWAKNHKLTDNTIEKLENEGLTDYEAIEILTQEEIACLDLNMGQRKFLTKAVQFLQKECNLKGATFVPKESKQRDTEANGVTKEPRTQRQTQDMTGDFNSKVSVENTCLTLKCEVEKILIERGSPSLYKVKNRNGKANDKTTELNKFEVGKEMHKVSEKVILVVGATGSGKTTLINSMVNYIFGVDFLDDCRLKLIVECTGQSQAQSQTSSITSYTIHYQNGMQVPYTLTIIDTPGFGDTSGITKDKEITNQIHELFTTKDGFDHLDAVCFVAQSSLARLTASQRYIFDSILSLFGKDIKENICMMLTFADGQKPQILDALQHAGLPTEAAKCFKFNNSAIFATNAEDSLEFYFWKVAMKGFSEFFSKLNHLNTKSLRLTAGVLKERAQLEVYVSSIRRDIDLGLSKLQELKSEKEVLQMHEKDLEQNKDFVYNIEEVKVVTEPVKQWWALNCKLCVKTCHDSCAVIGKGMTWACEVMKNRECKICFCKSSDHTVENYSYIKKIFKTKKTSENLKEQYLKAKEGKTSVAAMVQSLEDELSTIQTQLLFQAEAVRRSLKRLDEIALKPNPLSTTDYIDMLIECEKSEGKDGWKKRVESLQMFRKNAEQLQKLKDDKGIDFLQEYEKQKPDEAPEGISYRGSQIWKKAGEFLKSFWQTYIDEYDF